MLNAMAGNRREWFVSEHIFSNVLFFKVVEFLSVYSATNSVPLGRMFLN